ncbi:MAG: phosphoribosylanthranilate isomerase [Myxococcota bacterium]|jgi:phosphoribosylanthranilate isomerase
MFVKICGVTDEAGLAAASRADAVGFVFAESPRRISPQRAAELTELLPDGVETVAVFSEATQADIDAVCEVFRPDLIQTEDGGGLTLPDGVALLAVFHDGDGMLSELAAFAVNHPSARVILEGAAVGGQGVRADVSRAAQASSLPLRIILAGGLSPANVGDIISETSPWGVDVSSGVESSRGVKDPHKIHQFIDAAKLAARRTR